MTFPHCLKILTGSCLLLIFATVARPASATAPHYVFAHYMVCYAEYGQSVQGYQQEIQAAQAAGIDGFALDVGEWNGPDWYYKTNVELIYEAAESLNTGFKLFFSVDMGSTNDIVQMISAYANRTNSFYYNNRLVVSSFLLNSLNWTNGVFQPLQTMGISNIFFIPYFQTEAGFTWQTIGPGAGSLLSEYSFLDGLFVFASGTPSTVTNLDSGYGQACKSAGKLFMAGCSRQASRILKPRAGKVSNSNGIGSSKISRTGSRLLPGTTSTKAPISIRCRHRTNSTRHPPSATVTPGTSNL